MGNEQSMSKVNYHDMQNAIERKILIINTLKEEEQHCLIQTTCLASHEVKKINELLSQGLSPITHIFIYGRNVDDPLTVDKYIQLKKLGFRHVFMYTGGLFEWLLLQDIYGDVLFPTTSKPKDLLQFSSTSQFS
jgi:hypothetical protein